MWHHQEMQRRAGKGEGGQVTRDYSSYKDKPYFKDRKSLKGVPDLNFSDLDRLKLEALRRTKKSARQKARRAERRKQNDSNRH